MKNNELMAMIAHEYFHFLESRRALLFREKTINTHDEEEDIHTIVSESRADFFS